MAKTDDRSVQRWLRFGKENLERLDKVIGHLGSASVLAQECVENDDLGPAYGRIAKIRMDYQHEATYIRGVRNLILREEHWKKGEKE